MPCRVLNIGSRELGTGNWELGAGSRVMGVMYLSFVNSDVHRCV